MELKEQYQKTFGQLHTSISKEDMQRMKAGYIRKRIYKISMIAITVLCMGFLVGNGMVYAKSGTTLIEMAYSWLGSYEDMSNSYQTEDGNRVIVFGQDSNGTLIMENGESDMQIYIHSDKPDMYHSDIPEITLENEEGRYILHIGELCEDITDQMVYDQTTDTYEYKTTYESVENCYEISIQKHGGAWKCEVTKQDA